MPDVTQTATAPWEWQKGTKAYQVGPNTNTAWGRLGFDVDNIIDYKNAQKLIGTNASDALYGLWGDLGQQAGKAVPVTVKTEGWGDNATTRYFLPDGTEVFQNQYHEHGPQSIGGLAYEGGGEDGSGGQWVYRTPETVFNPRYGIRGSSTQENADWVKQTLRQIYPSATQEQLNNAAASALTKRGDHWHEEVNPTDIVRAIGAELGGVPTQYESYLKQLDPKFDERRAQIREVRNKADDASSGLKGFLSDLGPIGSIGIGLGLNALMPGLGAALGGGLGGAAGAGALVGGGVSALTGGDVLKGALLGGAGGALGQYSSGLEGSTAGISNANLANTLGKAGLNIAGGADPLKAIAGAGTSLAGSAGTNYLTGEGWNPDLAKAVVGAGLTGLRGGDIGNYLSNQALKYGVNQFGKSDIAALPTDQVAALGDNNMSGINWFQGDEAAPEDWGNSDISSLLQELGLNGDYSFTSDETPGAVIPLGDYENWDTSEDNYDLMPPLDTRTGKYDLANDNIGGYIDNSGVWHESGSSPITTSEDSLWKRLNSVAKDVRGVTKDPLAQMLVGALTKYQQLKSNKNDQAAYAAAQQAAQQRSPYFNATLQPVATSIGAGGGGFTIPTPRDPMSFIAPSTRGRG